MKWDDLTMNERSDLMGLFLKEGVSSLSDMKHIYNGQSNTKSKPILDKQKVINRVIADNVNYDNNGILDSIIQYFSNDDTAAVDRINDIQNYYNKNKEFIDTTTPENKYSRYSSLSDKDKKLFIGALSLDMIKQHEDAKRLYLGYPQLYGSHEISQYTPSISENNNKDYYQVNGLLSDSYFENLIYPLYNEWKSGDIKSTIRTKDKNREYRIEPVTDKTALLRDIPYLQNATISGGFDNKGEYISLYDVWDYNTKFAGKSGDNVGKYIGGKPFEIYQRYYLDDWLDIPEDARGNPFITPAVVNAEKKNYGGKIHRYDGTQDTKEYSGGTLKESNVSTTLSRDQWNNLYRQGKVSLTQVPRQYQSWIEGENSQFKKDVTNAMDEAGKAVGKIAIVAGSMIPVVGAAGDIVDIGTQLATGNYLGAGITAATSFLPEFLEKPISRLLRRKQWFKNIPKIPDFEGSESSVYLVGDRVFKVQDGGMPPMTKEEAKEVVDNYIQKRNSVPNQLPLKYEGNIPSKVGGKVHPVLSQQKVTPISDDIQDRDKEYIWNKLEDMMNKSGWRRQGSEFVSPEDLHVSDLKMENLGWGDDGKLYIIDGDTWAYGGLLHKYSGKDDTTNGGRIKPATITEKIGRKWDNLYWQKFRQPKDYSDEVANTPECAQWSNAQLRKMGYNIWGDAWTRSNQKVKKVFSGYDGLQKPKEYSYGDYRDYVLGAADNVKENFNWRDLKEGDIVGMYFRGSPNYQKAFLEGANGEAQTHTGHVVYRKGKPYITHNVHGDIKLNKAKKVLGRKHPFGIVSIYRPY